MLNNMIERVMFFLSDHLIIVFILWYIDWMMVYHFNIVNSIIFINNWNKNNSIKINGMVFDIGLPDIK